MLYNTYCYLHVLKKKQDNIVDECLQLQLIPVYIFFSSNLVKCYIKLYLSLHLINLLNIYWRCGQVSKPFIVRNQVNFMKTMVLNIQHFKMLTAAFILFSFNSSSVSVFLPLSFYICLCDCVKTTNTLSTYFFNRILLCTINSPSK